MTNNQQEQGYLTIREVVDLTRISKLTIYKLIARGKFPRQIQLSENRVSWKASEISQWLEDRAAARNQPQAKEVSK